MITLSFLQNNSDTFENSADLDNLPFCYLFLFTAA